MHVEQETRQLAVIDIIREKVTNHQETIYEYVRNTSSLLDVHR
jgi:hypothetical protein